MKFEIAPKSTEIQANWDDAKMYCFALNIDGKNGWRLPTKDELNQMRKSIKNIKMWHYYWTSTESGDYDAWSQNLTNGKQTDHRKYYDGFVVRAVRDLT